MWGKDMLSHNESLKKGFEKIRGHELQFKKSKCQTAANELVFPGHIVSSDAIIKFILKKFKLS